MFILHRPGEEETRHGGERSSLDSQTASQEVFGILSPGKHELVLKFLLTVNVDWIQLLLVDLTF